MNAPIPAVSLEARWKTYTKGLACLLPAVLAWLFAAAFLRPKLQQICAEVGVSFRGLNGVMNVVETIMPHAPLVLTIILALLLIAEWVDGAWVRIRGVAVTLLVVLLNGAMFTGLIAMCIAALLVAPHGIERARESASAAQPIKVSLER